MQQATTTTTTPTATAAATKPMAMDESKDSSSSSKESSSSSGSGSGSSVIVVCDYDLSMIEVNSDTFILKDYPQLKKTMRPLYESSRFHVWTDLMDHMCKVLHATPGIAWREADYRNVFASCPMHADMIRGLRAMHAARAQLYILSDANSVFIDMINAQHKVDTLFPKANIFTNPARFDAAGRLRVRYHHVLPHDCERCPRNLCKGAVLSEKILKQTSSDCAGAADEKKQPQRLPLVYLGDGGGDVCPCLRLQQGDLILARAGFSLAKQLQSDKLKAQVRAQLIVWSTWQEVAAAYVAFLAKHTSSASSTSAATSTTGNSKM
jgi:pyridoxal phosphate phosphatase PHOSPHO2